MKILKVNDTRDLVEENDRFVRVNGTGTKNACDLCGKLHEVHVHVEHDGAELVVGTGCASKQWDEFKGALKIFNAREELSQLVAPKNMHFVHVRLVEKTFTSYQVGWVNVDVYAYENLENTTTFLRMASKLGIGAWKPYAKTRKRLLKIIGGIIEK